MTWIVIAHIVSIVIVLGIILYNEIERFFSRRKLEDKLLRWDIHYQEARRCLAEFPDAIDALDYVKAGADGSPSFRIKHLRERMLQRGTADAIMTAER